MSKELIKTMIAMICIGDNIPVDHEGKINNSINYKVTQIKDDSIILNNLIRAKRSVYKNYNKFGPVHHGFYLKNGELRYKIKHERR